MESKYDYVVFDIETTGLHPDSDQICEIAAIGVKDGLPQGTFSTLVAIEGSMPEAAGRVNGITDDMLKGAPAIGDALDAFLDFIGEDAVLAGHNIASFDIPFVANAAAKSGRVFIYPYVIDTLEAARELWPDLPSRSMDSLRGILGIERRDAHRALADCYDELAVLNAELSVIMQSYARKMDYCRGELLRIAGEITEEIEGATGSTYDIQSGDEGYFIYCKAIDVSGNYSGELVSETVGQVVVSAKSPYSTYVSESITSAWTQVNKKGEIQSIATSSDDIVGQVLITSHGEASDE